MKTRCLWCVILLCLGGLAFGQVSALRDYVGLINQTFHPDIITYMNKFKADFEKNGRPAAAKSIDAFLKGRTGSGFIYVDRKGDNYILTNYHVITQSYTLSITFEKQDGTKTTYEGLSILAADEDMDIALLAFPGGERPFKQGLSFITRPVNDGEDVYSAGFPGLGSTPLWQFGRGMVSNAMVRFPADDDTDKIMGPYIQHTAQVDPGNSGGPLLVSVQGVPSGYAVAGINTLSARFRQAANYSIPMEQVQAFLAAALSGTPPNERELLEAQVRAFTGGLGAPKAVYDHIARYLSNDYIAGNAENAVDQVLSQAPATVRDSIIGAFNDYPANGMAYAVGWVVENALRPKTGKIDLVLDHIEANTKNGFVATFKSGEETVTTEWAKEYGIWRINSVNSAGGAAVAASAKKKEPRRRQNGAPDFNYVMLSAGYTHLFTDEPGFNAAALIPIEYYLVGLEFIYGFDNFLQVQLAMGGIYSFDLGKVNLMPFGVVGMGYKRPSTLPLRAYIQGGCIVHVKPAKGLFFTASYQFNVASTHMVHVGAGYGF